MPVIIDIKEDLRYQQGVEEGIEKDRNEIAENLLKESCTISFVQKITGLPVSKIEMIAQRLKENK